VFLAAACLALVGAGLQLAALYRGSFGLLLVGAALQVGAGGGWACWWCGIRSSRARPGSA
jgi:hypothetical protein